MKEHKSFVRDMDEYWFEIEMKGSRGQDDHFDAKFADRMLKEYGEETDFTAGELLKIWRK